ncbi:hypothetical protein RvY_00519 [Ramazzottius varieornatus]|uniref:Uncharacterized protein n=1 Tax=Ramazzottius varieornatus TaxID=947166 RepID=A0A1D1UNG2_RAMVA|nr:hypothetical protein RvY_00519 [Ramazzottius varieornatus]
MGPMEKSTVKTVPRRAAERQITRKQFEAKTANGDPDKKSSWIKMDPHLNIKNYAIMRHNAMKYTHRNEEVRRPKNLFVLHDNFWKQKAPFVVALSSKPSRKMLPHLRQYLLQKQEENKKLSQVQMILKDFKLVDSLYGPVVLTLKAQADAEMEFRTPNKVEKVPDFISKVLLHHRLKRLNLFLPNAGKVSLEFSDEDLIEGPSRRKPMKWYDYLTLSNASFLKQTRPQAALSSRLEERRARLHAKRLVRRYTGEYHHTHLVRSILKSKVLPSTADPNASNLDAHVNVPLSSESQDDHPEDEVLVRVAAQTPKGKSPNATKSGKNKNALDVESESLLSDDIDDPSVKGRSRVNMKRESGQNIRGAGLVTKDKGKTRGSSAATSHKPINEHPKVPAAYADGKTAESGDEHPKMKTGNRASASDDGQRDKPGPEEWPPWWHFDVSEGFSDQVKNSDQRPNPRTDLFESQMRLADRRGFIPAADKLDFKHKAHLTFQEKSLLDFVSLLKEKYDRTDAKTKRDRTSTADAKATDTQERILHPNSFLVGSFPEEIQHIVKRFQDIATGRLPDDTIAKPQAEETHKDSGETKNSLEQKFSLIGENSDFTSIDTLNSEEDSAAEDENLRISCEVRIDPEDYSWQLPQIADMRRKVAARCKYYDRCTDYLHSLKPLSEDQALSNKLRQMNLWTDNPAEATFSELPRQGQMRNLALRIDELAFTTCSTSTETIENRITGLVLQLQLAKLHVAHLADEAIDKAQRVHNHEAAMRRYAKVTGYSTDSPSICHALHNMPLLRTPPASPPRCPSPSKLAQDTGVDVTNEEDGKDKKSKGEKNADKNKKGKDVKANRSDDKKPRFGSDNAKPPTKKNSANSKHGPSK